MSADVLDLIDNVIGQHGDAMRWSPDEPKPTDPYTATARLTEAIIGALRALSSDLDDFVRRVPVALLIAAGDDLIEATRRANRIRAMHQLYRRKRR
jgi:hypothetical protein